MRKLSGKEINFRELFSGLIRRDNSQSWIRHRLKYMVDWAPEDLLARTAEVRPELAGPDMRLVPILKGGSDRRYYRVEKHGRPVQLIVVVYTDQRADNASFFPATDILTRHGVRVPRVHYHDPVTRWALIEDLGALDLWAFQSSAWPERRELYRRTLAEVAKLHRLAEKNLTEADRADLMPGFTEELYRWEQDYFFDHFVNNFSTASSAQIMQIRQSEALQHLRTHLGELPRFYVHRDFQSQNVIIRDGEAYLIDYQGVRPGRPEYDVASLLYDPYVNFTPTERAELWQVYQELRQGDVDWHTSEVLYAQCAAQRLMQALGAYGNLALNLGRNEFIDHIPAAVENLRSVIDIAGVPDLASLLEVRTLPSL